MAFKRIFLFLVLAFSPSLLFADGEATLQKTIAYFYGPVVYLGADGKTPYGQTVSLVQRTIDPENKTITELVSQPDRSIPNKTNDFLTFMVRQSDSSTFQVRDEGNTFAGAIIFSGSEWHWNQWDYNINLAAGGGIQGHGQLDENGITTHKKVLGKDGVVSVLVEENLAPISEDQYKDYRKKNVPKRKLGSTS